MRIVSKFNSLYWKLASLFFILILFVGFVYIFITTHYFSLFFDEVSQRINKNTASNIATHATPFLPNGKVNEPAMEDLFKQILSVNPNLEVYLLDSTGNILYFNTDESKVLLDKVSLVPVRRFIQAKGSTFIKGDDPRQLNSDKIFSAAPVIFRGRRLGYLYVMLESDAYNTVSRKLERNFFIRVGSHTMLLALFIALVIGLLFIRVLTNNFTRILKTMQQFREGDLSVRVPLKRNGELREFGIIFNDMADIFKENIEKLKEIELLRSRLIANISHDLRTPIVIIHGYLETLQMKTEALSEQERENYLNKIETAVIKLEKLISELFELSLLEAKQVRIHKEPVMISELVNDIGGSYQLEAKKRNIELVLQITKRLPPAFADIALIERVVQNLIDNALKFTPENGRIVISTAYQNGQVLITVSDSGKGISKEKLDQIFTGFYKENNFNDVKYSTGLGLIIVKKILELHDSNLEIVSSEDKGSAFSFSLPVYIKE